MTPTQDSFEFMVTIKADDIIELIPESFQALLLVDRVGPILVDPDRDTATITITDAIGKAS